MTVLGLDVNEAFAQDNAAFTSEELEARQFWDDLSGKELEPRLVKKAREDEMREFRKHNVYVKVPIEESGPTLGRIQ